MSFLLDTCTISEIQKKKPNEGVINFLNSINDSSSYISAITVGEITKGISLIPSHDKRKTTLSYWLENLVTSFSERILPISTDICVVWGNLSASHQKLGLVLPIADGLIASTAIFHNLTIVTRNEDDFSKTGANILNPWS